MPDRADVLLHKALQGLTPDERDELLRALLAGRLASGSWAEPAAPGAVVAPGGDTDRERVAALLGAELDEPRTGMKVLPVRLPEVDLDRLRRFSRASGFSMAVVVRALVERFLDQRGVDGP